MWKSSTWDGNWAHSLWLPQQYHKREFIHSRFLGAECEKKNQMCLEVLYNWYLFNILISASMYLISTKHQQTNFLLLKPGSGSDVLADGL